MYSSNTHSPQVHSVLGKPTCKGHDQYTLIMYCISSTRCVICDDASCTSPRFKVPAILDESGLQVSCVQTVYSTGLDIDRLDVELRVVGDGDRRIDNPDNAKGVCGCECVVCSVEGVVWVWGCSVGVCVCSVCVCV